MINSRPHALVCWSGTRSSCAVHFEGSDNGCRYSFDCCAILRESFADPYVNFVDRIGHLDRRHIDHNHRFLGTGHRGSDHGNRPIPFSCRFGNGLH